MTDAIDPTATDAQDGPLVFVSCGQATAGEKSLGKAIAELVKEITGATAYFAENQTSLDALTKNVFGALNRASAFIAVMHKRGRVTNENGALDRTRASVWIEQEIAIASFIQATRNADLKVAAYIERGICVEGARSMLILNPEEFTTDSQVMEHLEQELKEWKLQPRLSETRTLQPQLSETAKVELSMGLDRTGTSDERHDYLLDVRMRNASKVIIDDFVAVLQFPGRFLERGARIPPEGVANSKPQFCYVEQLDQSTFYSPFRYFQQSNDDQRRFLPGDSWQLFSIAYKVTEKIYEEHQEDFSLPVTVRVFVDSRLVGSISKPFRELQRF